MRSHDKPPDEWRRQAARDLAAAEHLLTGGFLPHAVVCAHLAAEKALKGLLRAQSGANPPVSHDLVYLAGRCDLTIPDALRAALAALSAHSVVTLYPDRLLDAQAVHDRAAAEAHVAAARDLLDWVGDHLDGG